VEIFASLLHQLESQHIPCKKRQNSKKKAPWITYKAVKLINKKHKIYKHYKSKSHPAYVKAARAADTELKRAKRSFEKKRAKSIDKDRKSFFSYMRNRSTSKPTIGPLVNDAQQGFALQPHETVEEFNEYFSSVFTVEDTENLPKAKPVFLGSEDDKLKDIVIDKGMVKKKLDSLRTDKAAGVDGFSPRVLVELCDVICTPLIQIMNNSLQTGVVPDERKAANVIPVHKSGNKGQVSNYRPISLTSIICKL